MITSLQEGEKVNPLLQREAVANQSRLFFQSLHFCAALLLASNLGHKLSKTLHCQKCHISTYCTWNQDIPEDPDQRWKRWKKYLKDYGSFAFSGNHISISWVLWSHIDYIILGYGSVKRDPDFYVRKSSEWMKTLFYCQNLLKWTSCRTSVLKCSETLKKELFNQKLWSRNATEKPKLPLNIFLSINQITELDNIITVYLLWNIMSQST